MSLALAAVLLSALACASQAALPLPGYASSSARAENDDLRDALISPPSSAWLMAGLRSSHPADRLAAVHSAAIPRNVAAVPPLAAVMLRLDEKPEIRAAAAAAIGRIGDAVAEPSLDEALNDPAPEVRYAAALALSRLSAAGAAARRRGRRINWAARGRAK